MRFGPELLWVLIAMAGGIARYLDQYLKTGQAPKLGLMLGHAVVSGFAGYMVVQITIKFQPDWAVIAAGAGGYLGIQGLEWLSWMLRARVASYLPPPRQDMPMDPPPGPSSSPPTTPTNGGQG